MKRSSLTLRVPSSTMPRRLGTISSISSPSPPTAAANLRKAIDRDFGSFEDFKKAFVDAGVGLFGSGWVWLSRDEDGKLFITQGPNAGNPITTGLTPLLTFDVWEHAYYLDYQNRRADALTKLWDIVDWDVVESRY